jgi:ketosteroid isomerase-like protein
MYTDSTDIVKRYFHLLEAKDIASWADLLSDDARYEVPFTDKTFGEVMEGREAIVQLFSPMPSLFAETRILDLSVFPTTEAGVFFVEYRIEFQIAQTQYWYCNTIVQKFGIRDGKIALVREYLNPIPRAKFFAKVSEIS